MLVQQPGAAAAEPVRAASPPRISARTVRNVFRVAVAVLGGAQAWALRYVIDPDGVSYLDLGNAYLRGDWTMALNSYWSPLYAWLVALASRVTAASPFWEIVAVHAVNLALLLSLLFCFEFFVRGLIDHQRRRVAAGAGGAAPGLPEPAWWALAYSLFLWLAFRLIGLGGVVPDMLTTGLIFLATGLVLRIASRAQNGAPLAPSFAALGILLGLAYLAKAFMFLLAPLLIACAVLAAWRRPGAIRMGALALLGFATVAGPFVAALSVAHGRPTFGDSGGLNYAWYVNGATVHVHWQGGGAGGRARNPTRVIVESPTVHEFARPRGGSYPPWYDPPYWHEGIVPRFELRQQLRHFVSGLVDYAHVLRRQQEAALVGLLILFLAAGRWRATARELAAQWVVLVPALAGLFMFALVHVETRFTGVFLVLLAAGLLAACRFPRRRASWPWLRAVVVAVTAYSVIKILVPVAGSVRENAAAAFSLRDETPHLHWRVSRGLARMGLRPGDAVAVVGNPFYAYWARLAGLQIIADLFSRSDLSVTTSDEELFWAAEQGRVNEVLARLREAGAAAVIATRPPPAERRDAWRPVDDTGFYALLLRSPGADR